MAYNNQYDCVVSVDEAGMIEYWRPSGDYEKPDGVFKYKSSTDLFEFKKAKSLPTCITIPPSGSQFATFSFPDRKVRIFDFATAKLYRTYDESLSTVSDMQQAGTAQYKLEELEFGRRLAIERELENPTLQNKINAIFDESSNFIIYGSILGTKVINTLTNRVVKVYGKDEPFRPLNIAIYQGQPLKKGVVTVSMAASANPLLEEAEQRDPLLVSTGSGKIRFYMFTNQEDIIKSTRDVQNEKPRNANAQHQAIEAKPAETGSGAILHTTFGDIHIRLFPEAAPKAVENFVTHSKNGYYNNTIFHRVLRKFMIQVKPISCLDLFFSPSPFSPSSLFSSSSNTLALFTTTNSAAIPSATAPEVNPSGATNSATNSQPSNTTNPTRSQWRTQARTPMVANSLSRQKRPLGWIRNIQSLDGRCEGWMSFIGLRMYGFLRRGRRRILRL